MISPSAFIEALRANGVGLLTGVPDSLLSSFCAYVDDHGSPGEHIVAANEGNAIALAAGYHLGTGKIAAVYLQNSGLGNAVNPLTSLTDPQVYRIPLLMIVGWRGEPGVKDEPQHVKQGRVTKGMLELLEIPHWILDPGTDLNQLLPEVFATIKKTNAPVALLVRKDTFAPYKSMRGVKKFPLKREDALASVLELASPNDLIVSTTGKTSRELFELRVRRAETQRDFLTVGSMGHTSSIAAGVALSVPQKRVICLDGDGSLLMHMGAMPIIGDLKPANFVHILLNNAAHESVGGQGTVAGQVDFGAIAKACGYTGYEKAADDEGVKRAWRNFQGKQGPLLLEILVACGSRDDLGRPTSTAEENKNSFIAAVNGK